MIRFFRLLFGLNGVTGNRTVAGKPDSIAIKDLPYIQDSKKRLTALHELYTRYQGTPHAQKILAVYDKTKRIHTYLADRSRVHELELFHLQHTDHFLSTFTAIIDTHRPKTIPTQDVASPSSKPQQSQKPTGRPEVIGKTFVLGPFRRETKEVKAVKLQNKEKSRRIFVETVEDSAEVAKLHIPDVAIDTFSKIVYLKEDRGEGLSTNEIGYTSSVEEKEAFVDFVTSNYGLSSIGIVYVGNALVYLPENEMAAEMVPIIHWNGAHYAVCLEEHKLFPVSTFRKRQ